ncbi:MAG: bifunctional phosphopantothenoylcysteine decarboxylase/phosphopantothenate--cysteine ligase CoaBC [Proteobacteria bacterium]|nr:bifunctional phosphopantothenoylcysteine decarboxylase/phosphopantothenate--cysteine ligase CoaBC [Pseudomonadota bacterium]
MAQRRILLIVGGGIAAYKALELVRLIRKAGMSVRAVLTQAGTQFVTPLSLAALTEDRVYQDLFSLTDEHEMGHIELSRDADLLVVAPATANLMARMANGLADDLASTVLLATDKPVLVAPAMNVRMWLHPATRRNMAALRADGVQVVGPDEGEMACGEFGPGRMAEPAAILATIEALLGGEAGRPLQGRRALVTAGPTFEPIDPVRGMTNRSSGKQGYAVAQALAGLGAEVTLVSGPTALPVPFGVKRVDVQTAMEMEEACRAALPVDVAVCVAAVADWRPESIAGRKIKKTGGEGVMRLVENPDILAGLSKPGPERPKIVVGFAAETNDVEAYARAKLKAKGCDLIVANAVGGASGGVFGEDQNTVTLVAHDGIERWERASKAEVGRRLALKIAEALGERRQD